MKLNSGRAVETLSSVFFLLLFPGFYLYNQMVAASVISPVLRGFFLPVSVLTVLAYAPFSKYIIYRIVARPIYSYFLVAFLIWCNASAFLTFYLYPTENVGQALVQHLSVMLAWISLMLVGIGLSFDAAWFRRAIMVSGLAIVAHLTYYIVNTGSFQYLAVSYYGTDEGATSHQAFARSALMVAFAALALRGTVTRQVIVTVMSVGGLFVLAARSEFVAVVLVVATFFIIRIKEDKGKILGVVLVFLSLSILVASYSERLDETRQAKVLDIGSDQSWASRQALMDDALERIAGAPFTGRFGGHFENGGAGSYVHNILSAWDGYGLIAFVLVIFIVAVPLWESLGVVYKRRELTPFQAFYFFVSLSTFVLLLGAKTIYWPIPGLLWGLCLNKAFRREGRVVGGNLMTIN